MHSFLLTLFLLLLPLSTLKAAVNLHPLKKMRTWFQEEKQRSDHGFSRLATLSTVNQEGHPQICMIQIKRMNQKNGILFFTHRNTSEAENLTINPFGALHIYLPKTLRQISINGQIQELSHEVAESLWKPMSRFMKLTFLASEHKGPLTSSKTLEERKTKFEELYKDTPIPMPDSFVGYSFIPKEVVFHTNKPRRFPEKEMNKLEKDKWISSQLEP